MKINLTDIEKVEKNPIELFYDGIKAEATKERYTRILKNTLCNILEDVLTGTFEERATQFVKKAKNDPDWALSVMLSLAGKLKERTKLPRTDKNYYNPSSFGNYFKPLKKLLDMNGVPVVWKRVYATFPEHDNTNEGRGYKREEIQKMLESTGSWFNKSIILVAASSGIREGGFALKWNHLMPVYRVDNKILLEITESQEKDAKIVCAILKIYDGTSDYYPAFITPEAYGALMEWKIQWTKEVGREPKPGDPIFKVEGNVPIMCKPTAIKRHIERLLITANIRHELPKGMRRYEVPVMNGFRRFFNKVNKETTSKDSPLAALIKKEYMMSHTGLVKTDKNYFKSHVLELVEEYLHAVPALTIDDAERKSIENEELRIKNESLTIQRDEFAKMQKQLAEHQSLLKHIDKLGFLQELCKNSNTKEGAKKFAEFMANRAQTFLQE